MRAIPTDEVHSFGEARSWLATGPFAILLLLFVLATFPEVIFGSRTFFYRDFSIFGYPLAHHLRESLWRGEFPLWNPLNNGGVPFLAQWNTMTLYPLSLFFVALPLSWSLGAFSIGHIYLGGIGMYLLARRWSGHNLAGAVAGFVYTFNGFACYALVWPQITAALAWAPFVLLLVENTERKRTILYAAVVGALQMLTGGVEIVLFTWGAAGALMILHSVTVRPLAVQWRNVARFAVIVASVAGLSAAQLLPFLDLVAHSQRGDAFDDGQWPMHVTGWANFLLPLFRTFRSFHDVHMQLGQQWTSSYYLGIATIALSLLALIRTSPRSSCSMPAPRGDARAWLLWTLIVFSCLLALGDQSPIYKGLRTLLPWLGAMRYPVKFVIVSVLCLPLLAALGVEKMLAAPRPAVALRALVIISAVASVTVGILAWYGSTHFARQGEAGLLWCNAVLRVVFLGLFVAAIGAVARARHQRWEIAFTLLALGLLWIDQRTHLPKLQPTVARSVYEPGLVRAYLQLPDPPAPGEGRMMPSYDSLQKMQRSSVPSAEDECLGRRLALSGNLNLLDGLSKPNGFFALYPRQTAEFGELLYSQAQGEREPLKDFLSAAYITVPESLTEWSSRQSALPFVTCGQQPIFASDAETLRALGETNFDPKRFVYLPLTEMGTVSTNPGTARVVAQSFSSHTANIAVEASSPSLVVIGQSYYHCWRALLDGQPVKLLRANHAFQAVAIPEGDHHITLQYRDKMFEIGSAVSLLSLIGVAAAWWSMSRGKCL